MGGSGGGGSGAWRGLSTKPAGPSASLPQPASTCSRNQPGMGAVPSTAGSPGWSWGSRYQTACYLEFSAGQASQGRKKCSGSAHSIDRASSKQGPGNVGKLLWKKLGLGGRASVPVTHPSFLGGPCKPSSFHQNQGTGPRAKGREEGWLWAVFCLLSLHSTVVSSRGRLPQPP